MRKFAIYSVAMALGLAMVSALVLYWGLLLSEIKAPLLPRESSTIPWVAEGVPAAPVGETRLEVTKDGKTIEFDFNLSSAEQYPYTGYNFNFVDATGDRRLIDLSGFEGITLNVTCSPRNILLLVLFTFDDKATDVSDPGTYRVNWHFFTCDNFWQKDTADLREFETPDWWLQNAGLELVDRGYDLTQVAGFAVINSLQSPRDIASQVKLSGMALTGTNRTSIIVSVGLVVCAWAAFIYMVALRYVRAVVAQAKARMKEDLPLTAYQKLSLSPQKDRTKSKLLVYLATDYADPGLNVDLVVDKLGINRNKINEILREELGLTFTAYVNKLRLTEAARLLSVHRDETIAQIAYKVGYNNVTYFNKLFKSTYGCSPKQFKENVGEHQP